MRVSACDVLPIRIAYVNSRCGLFCPFHLLHHKFRFERIVRTDGCPGSNVFSSRRQRLPQQIPRFFQAAPDPATPAPSYPFRPWHVTPVTKRTASSLIVTPGVVGRLQCARKHDVLNAKQKLYCTAHPPRAIRHSFSVQKGERPLQGIQFCSRRERGTGGNARRFWTASVTPLA